MEMLFQKLQAFCELPAGNIEHARKRRSLMGMEDRGKVLIQASEDCVQKLALQLNDVLRTIDEAEFDVERVILGEMAAGRVRLGPIYVTCFEDSLQARHGMFLVKLRTLRQICDTVEVLQLEQICSAFRSRRHDLGSENLREALGGEILAEILQQGGLHAKDVPNGLIS